MTAVEESQLFEVGSVEDAQVALARLLSVTSTAQVRSRQLQEALDSRIAIEQAKGILAERYGLGVNEAFELIRRAARANRIKLRGLAEAVIRSRETPHEIAAQFGEERAAGRAARP